jgi:hypothetical protein
MSAACTVARTGAPASLLPSTDVAKIEAYATGAHAMATRTAKALSRLAAHGTPVVARLIADYQQLATTYTSAARGTSAHRGGETLSKVLLRAEMQVALDASEARLPGCGPPPPRNPIAPTNP